MTTQAVWFADRHLVRQLPLLFRLYGLYSRLMFDRGSGRVLGGSLLLRLLARLIRMGGLQDQAALRIGDRVVYLDLCDPRLPMVIHEVRGSVPDLDVLAQVLRPGDTFVDVGANHGTYSIAAAGFVGPSGAVVAVEAIPRLARLVEKTLAGNGVRNFEVHAVAVADTPGVCALFVPINGSGSASVYVSYERHERKRTIEVQRARLDDTLGWDRYPGRVVMKLDVEGSELACLRGATRFIVARRPVIMLEINPTSALAAGQEAPAVLRFLETLGYDRVGEIAAFPHTAPIGQVDCTTQRNVLVHPAGVW